MTYKIPMKEIINYILLKTPKSVVPHKCNI